ncbi:MAG: heme A synthase [Acidimicrobiia bacterium]|nr:heme A synthase [Acidimicrobiia bacterium]MBJ7513202.1 heme A synthase [Acidimicrobiia bacterium]
MKISPEAYRRVTIAACLMVAVIIVTGAAVRLTGSGLGCSSWPNCSPGQLTPRDATSYHAMIEFINRTFTGAVSIAVIAAVLGSFFRSPRRRDLIWLSLGLVGGVIAQIVLGGITVLTDLHPAAVMSHFLLSMLLLADAVILVERAGYPDDRRSYKPELKWERRLPLLQFIFVSVVVVAGTVATNSGPHAGDQSARRFNIVLTDIVRIHSIAAIILLITLAGILFLSSKTGVSSRRRRDLTLLLSAVVIQMTIGYVQYFTGVPALLVSLHIVGAVLVFITSLRFFIRTNRQMPMIAMSAENRVQANEFVSNFRGTGSVL